jgi:hypothetical protein
MNAPIKDTPQIEAQKIEPAERRRLSVGRRPTRRQVAIMADATAHTPR